MRQRGFTLLEMLVATAIMGIAVVGLLSNLSTSMRNAANLTGYDRAVALARAKMDELLLDPRLPRSAVVQGTFDKALTGDTEVDWRAQLSMFEMPPNARPMSAVLERIELEVSWGAGQTKRKLMLDGYRRTVLTPADVPPQPQAQ